MSVDTKMFIAAKKEAMLEIMPKVISALNKWQRNELAHYAESIKGVGDVFYDYNDYDDVDFKILP